MVIAENKAAESRLASRGRVVESPGRIALAPYLSLPFQRLRRSFKDLIIFTQPVGRGEIWVDFG